MSDLHFLKTIVQILRVSHAKNIVMLSEVIVNIYLRLKEYRII